jgi:hypothetical protein
MTKEKELENRGTEVDDLLELFGPAPILESESLQAYQEIMRRLLEEFKPCNVIEQMFIKELTDCIWEMARYTRQNTLLMQRRLLQRLEYQEKSRGDVPQHDEGGLQKILQSNEQLPTCPDDLLDQVIDEIDAILLQSDREERNHFSALEVAFVYYDRIDRLLASATARRNNVVNRIERYRGKFDGHLRRVCDLIVQDTIGSASKLEQQ